MLARIEQVDGVGKCWVSSDGAFVVVVPRGDSSVREPVQAILDATRPSVLLDGINRETVLASFESERGTWIRGARNTKELTRMEADIVGDHVVERVAARLEVTESERRRIQQTVSRRFYRARVGDDDGGLDRIADEIGGLRDEVREALRKALAIGLRPESGDE